MRKGLYVLFSLVCIVCYSGSVRSMPEEISAKEPIVLGGLSLTKPIALGSLDSKSPVALGSKEQVLPISLSSSEPRKTVDLVYPKNTVDVSSNNPKQVDEPLPSESNQVDEPLPSESNQVDEPLPSESNQVDEPLPSESNQVGEPLPSESNQVDEPYSLNQDDYMPIPLVVSSETENFASIYWTDSDRDYATNWGISLLNRRSFSDGRAKYYKLNEFRLNSTFKDIVRLLGIGFLTITKDPSCGRKAAFVECLLERHGIPAHIIVADKFQGNECGHAWVEVVTPLNETLYIDASKGENYMVLGDEYKPMSNGIAKSGYHVFSDIGDAIDYYGIESTPRFAWWSTEWGKIHIN